MPLRRHERPLLPLTVQQALSKLPVMLSGPGLQLVLCLQTNNLLSTRARFLHVLARTLSLQPQPLDTIQHEVVVLVRALFCHLCIQQPPRLVGNL